MLPSPITYAAGNALLHSYHSTMESLQWQDIINLIMIEEEQEGTACYHPSDRDRTVHPETKSTVREERKDSDPHTQRNGENHKARIDQKQRIDKPLRLRVMSGHSSDHDMEVPGGLENIGYGKTKKRKTDTDVPEPVKKLKTSGYKSVRSSNTSKDPEENSDHKLDVLRRGHPELLPNTEEEPKAVCQKDYVYVRARRGQASDSHSLAERARREKIKGRMKILQDLVPGCNKITSKVLVLEEIINYVQSLQNQVQTLSMTLASVPLADFGFQTNGYQSTEIQHPILQIQQWQNMTLIEDIHRQ